MKVVAMIPVKLNSQRFPGKNFKHFDDGTPLIHLVQKAVLGSANTDEAYIYCSANDVKPYILEGICLMKRDKSLDLDTVNSNDLLREFIQKVDADIYYTTHVTAPFTRSASLDKCISAVMGGDYDSAFMAEKIQRFVWQNESPLNFDPDNIVRTQDLEPLYVETSNAFVFHKSVFAKYHRRVGRKPYIHECTTEEGIDIDYPDDFMIANAIYMNKLNLKEINTDQTKRISCQI
jgi:CMP-N-acetylneuraminic acid synthetase